jgi:hypothetical protein
MTVTLITEDVEVPDFLCVAIPYEALFPQLLDPIPGTQCMGAQMAPSQPYMVRVPYPCRDQKDIAFPCFRFVVPGPVGIVFQARTLFTNRGVRPCFPLIQQDAWSWTAERQLFTLSPSHVLSPRFVFRFDSGFWQQMLVVRRRTISASRLLRRCGPFAHSIFR